MGREVYRLASGAAEWGGCGRGALDRCAAGRHAAPVSFDLDHACDVLGRTPGLLHAFLDGVDEVWTRGTEGPQTFSPFDVVGHLIDGEETDWIVRARIILSRGPDPAFAPYDRFRHATRNRGRTLASLLEEFERLRGANLALLRSWRLSPEHLALPGRHPELGPVTLEQLLAAWVVHDLGHVAQIARVMAKQYRAEVGPWAAYLPVLTDRERPRS